MAGCALPVSLGEVAVCVGVEGTKVEGFVSAAVGAAGVEGACVCRPGVNSF